MSDHGRTVCQARVLRILAGLERGRMDGQVEGATDRLVTAIAAFAEPLLADMGLELVEIQYRREGHGWILRFFIDREDGVGIDDCAKASREIGARSRGRGPDRPCLSLLRFPPRDLSDP